MPRKLRLSSRKKEFRKKGTAAIRKNSLKVSIHLEKVQLNLLRTRTLADLNEVRFQNNFTLPKGS